MGLANPNPNPLTLTVTVTLTLTLAIKESRPGVDCRGLCTPRRLPPSPPGWG